MSRLSPIAPRMSPAHWPIFCGLRARMPKKAREKVYECISCGTTFKESDGEHKYGYLVCPRCGSEDLREISEKEQEENND